MVTARRQAKNNEHRLGLTQREFEIVSRISNGANNKDLAKEFNCSIKTVQAHRFNIYHKMGVHTAPQMVLHALNYMRSHLVSPIVDIGPGID